MIECLMLQNWSQIFQDNQSEKSENLEELIRTYYEYLLNICVAEMEEGAYSIFHFNPLSIFSVVQLVQTHHVAKYPPAKIASYYWGLRRWHRFAD